MASIDKPSKTPQLLMLIPPNVTGRKEVVFTYLEKWGC